MVALSSELEKSDMEGIQWFNKQLKKNAERGAMISAIEDGDVIRGFVVV